MADFPVEIEVPPSTLVMWWSMVAKVRLGVSLYDSLERVIFHLSLAGVFYGENGLSLVTCTGTRRRQSAWAYAHNNPIPEWHPSPEAGANEHTSLIDIRRETSTINLNSIGYSQWKVGKSCFKCSIKRLVNSYIHIQIVNTKFQNFNISLKFLNNSIFPFLNN